MQVNTNVSCGGAEATATSGHGSLPGKIAGLAGWIGILVLAQHAREDEWSFGATAALAVVALISTIFLWRARRNLIRMLSSTQFAAVLLIVIALAAAVGTLLPQGAASQELEDRFGATADVWIERLFLYDLFHTLWFYGLLALLAVSLSLMILLRKVWRVDRWGYFLTQGGLVAIVCGILIGLIFGDRGTMDLRLGKASGVLMQDDRSAQALDFELKLNAFEVEKHPDEYRLNINRSTEQRPRTVVSSLSVDEARGWTSIPGSSERFRVLQYYPDIQIQDTMRASNDESHPPAIRAILREGKQQKERWLVSETPDTFSDTVTLEYLVPKSADAAAATWQEWTAKGKPARHLLLSTCCATPLEVRVGESYTAPGTNRKFTVVQFMPDYYFDLQKKQAATRGDEPNNPALCIEALKGGGESARQWLFAKMPGHGKKSDSFDLTYKLLSATPPLAHVIGIDGLSQELIYCRGGKIIKRQPFKPGEAQQIDLAPTASEPRTRTISIEIGESLAHAEPERVARSLSQEPKNPGVLVEIQRGEDARTTRQEYLVAARGTGCVVAEDTTLYYERKPGEVNSCRSRVSVIRGGQVAENAVIASNAPFSYEGFTFYQSGYRVNDPKFSSLKVVRDPGLSTVYAGLVMIALGVVYIYCMRLRLPKRGAESVLRAEPAGTETSIAHGATETG